MRPREHDISTLSSTGIPADLSRYHRKPKQETRALVPDDGFRSIKTQNQDIHRNPKVHEITPKPLPMMLTWANLDEHMLVNRPHESKREGFGSLLPQHDRNNKRRYMSNEYRAEVSDQPKFSTPDIQKHREKHAGTVIKPD